MSNNRADYDATERVGEKSSPPATTISKQGTNIGILSIASYFPKTYVSQEDLEKYDQVDSGKYTKGLMQDKMGFCTDLEDINSIALTVTQKLLDESGVSPKDIGYLEVGTETILDKSKSVKTVLMDLFENCGNTDIEGVDTTNACYGGTAALFHAIDHCYSPFWDGRLAIVVTADIAVYDKGNARPTGGCGAVAMLIGPNAPLVFDLFRATHMTHTYDFYKPDPYSEYPTVDGKLSLQAYITALDKCYHAYRKKHSAAIGTAENSLLDEFDGILFHSPYCKLVRKGFARLLFNEFDVICKSKDAAEIIDDRYKEFKSLHPASLSNSYDDWMKPIDKTSLEKVSIASSEKLYQEKTSASLFIPNQVGNMYTASLYSCLVAYLTSKSTDKLVGKNILLFSYGSGSAASMFSARLSSDTKAVDSLISGIKDVRIQLNDRIKVSPQEFTAHLDHRKKTFSKPSRYPTGQPIESESGCASKVSVEGYLFPGTYYLTSIDQMFRRKYSKLEPVLESNNNNDAKCIVNKKSQINHVCVIFKNNYTSMNQMVIDPNQLSLTESQIAAFVVDENVGSVQLNMDILRQFKLTNRLACKILCALCEFNLPKNNSGNNGGPGTTGNGQSSSDRNTAPDQGSIKAEDYLPGRKESLSIIKEVDLFAEYCRQNDIRLQNMLQAFDDEDFISDRIFRNTNFVLQSQKNSSVPVLPAFQRFIRFCTSLAFTDPASLSPVGFVFFTQVWQHNQEFQLNFIANCIEQNLVSKVLFQPPLTQKEQQINLSQLVPYSELLKCQPDFDLTPELNNWKFQRLYQILIDFTVPSYNPNLQMSSNCFARVLELFNWPLQYCPDLAVLGLLGTSGQASAAKVEILSLAIPTFLNASHPNAAIILHSIWSNDSHQTDSTSALAQQKPNAPLTWSQKTLLQALSDHYIKSPPEEQQQRLSRILDVAQDIKTLFRLLDGNCYPFVIDLACLASRREYLKLDKWLMDKFTENGENFMRALISFLTKRYLPFLGSNKDVQPGSTPLSGPALPAETLAVMLTFLQQCVMPPAGPAMSSPFTELSQAVKKEVYTLVGNSSILLQRAPRHPPPGVATSMANDFSRMDRLVNFPGMSEVERFQAELDAKRLSQRVHRPTATPTQNPPQMTSIRPSIANNANIDHILAAGVTENYPVPPMAVQDKVFFIVNNLSLANVKDKVEEFKELFGTDETYYAWMAQYFSTKRAAVESNFQPLYANFLYELKNPKLVEAMTRETYKNIKHLLRSDKKVDNINERTVLKNLGQWLGLLTLARNKPILHVDLDLKGLLVEAYHKGTQELLYVVPFLAEILKTTQKSKIFKPNNPFVLGLLRALVELRQQPNLKLNLEFQVEVLFNNLGIDLNKLVGQSNILNDEKYYSKIECQLGPKQVPNQSVAQPMMQSMKAPMPQQQTGAQQVGHSINPIVMRPNEFGSSLSPLNTPPLTSIGSASVLPGQIGPNMSGNITTSQTGWSSKFKYGDLDVTNTASLNNLITIQSSLGIFNLQPNLKNVVRPAIELAISEWLPTILEKSLKIALPTVEHTVKKDFALHPDENHMQRAAHSMIRQLVSYMAMILCRDPEQVEQSLLTNLKQNFTRNCPTIRKEQAEHAAALITVDNLELARAFIIKAAIERGLADIDKVLQSEYDLRRAARLEGHQYYDAEQLAFHTKLINDGIRLKPSPTSPDQLKIYEEIGQNVAGFKHLDMSYNDPSFGSTSPFNEVGANLNIAPVVGPNPAELSKASPMGAAGLGNNIVSQLISNRITPNQFAQQIPGYLNIEPDLLMRLKAMTANQAYAHEIQACIEALQTKGSISSRTPSNYMANQGQQLSSANPTNPSPQLQNTTNSNAIPLRETVEGDPPGLAEKTQWLLREWVTINQTGQVVKMFPAFVQSMTAHGILKTDDLVQRFFRLSTELCVESCYRLLSSQPNGLNSLELRSKCYETLDAFTMLIVLLIKNSGSSSSPSNMTTEPAARINLLSRILSIIANVAIKDQEDRQSDFQHLAYYRILILLFIELNLSPPLLGLPSHQFNNFNQIPGNVDVLAENVQFQVLNEFSKTLRTLRPSRVPSFAFAWLDFLSHRLFIEKCLNGFPANRPPGSVYKGWALYAQLLIDLIKFEGPFLRNVELPASVDLLYKGTLKIFLVLLHDFPEFLCEYCYSLCDVIPCNAIQLRNLVLSAFPRKMRLPDPFTPNLKIDQLPEMSQPPKTGALQNNLINSVAFKDELESYLRTRTPTSFVSNLIGYLRSQNQYLMSLGGSSAMNSGLNVPLMNALVLYVGQSAIAALAPRPINMTLIGGMAHMDIFQHLATNLDTEGRYLFLNAIANQLRYPNSHTHYFSSSLLYLFGVATSEQIQEQITRVLVERLIIMRPHPWGLLVTFIELIKNPIFKFWQHDFVRCAPQIEKLFESVARSCCVQNTGSAQEGK